MTSEDIVANIKNLMLCYSDETCGEAADMIAHRLETLLSEWPTRHEVTGKRFTTSETTTAPWVSIPVPGQDGPEDFSLVDFIDDNAEDPDVHVWAKALAALDVGGTYTIPTHCGHMTVTRTN